MSKNTSDQREFSEETLKQLKAMLDPPEQPTDAIDTLQSIADNDGLAIIDRMPRTKRDELFNNIRLIHQKRAEIADLGRKVAAINDENDEDRVNMIIDIDHLDDEIERSEERCLDLMEPIAKSVIGA